jgi:hypothetical protein
VGRGMEGIGLVGLRQDRLVGGDIDRDVAGNLMMQRIVRRVLGIEQVYVRVGV